jgi:eukaryotic-like serine/threonine-protein kinase
MVGQTVGKYRIVSRLGRGGMGTVYKAVDETLDREVAIKCLNTELNDPDLLKRFRAEAVTLARLNHPNIATLFELGDHDGQMMMVMEFVRGETFDRVSAREGPMDIARAAQLCAQVLDALQHAHHAGVVHRDLKPANLMLTQAGIVKVMDFGLARMIGTEHLTNDGYMVGTPAYMSPEQVLGRDIDGRADLYAMGVVLFRLLTSQLPFKADSGVAMVQRQLHDPPTPVRHVRSELPVACEEVLTRALEKVAANRYQTADEFRSALTRLDPSLASTSASRVPSSVVPAPSAVTVADGAGVQADTLVLPRDGGAKSVKAAPRARASRAGLAPSAVAAGIVLLAGIPVTGVLVWHARQAAAESSAAPATPSSAAPSTASTPAAPPPPDPARTKAAEKSASGAPAPKKAPKPAAVVPASDASRAALPVAIFSRIRLLILGEHEPRDRDATLRLAADGFEVLDGTRALETASWQDVIGLYHSHSKEPWWTNANGQSAPIARPGGGGFGFLKGTPNWITLRTRRNFVPLRVREEDVARLITELEARADLWVVTAK